MAGWKSQPAQGRTSITPAPNSDYPRSIPEQIRLPAIVPAQNASVTLLGARGELKWERQGADLLVLIPASLQKSPPCDYAWTIKISAQSR